MDQRQNQTDKANLSLFSEEEKQAIAKTLASFNLPSGVEEEIGERILTRIGNALVEQDLKGLESLKKENADPKTIKFFLLTKIPNLDLIIREEIEFYETKQPALTS